MPNSIKASVALAVVVIGVSSASAQPDLVDVLRRHGVSVRGNNFDAAFDAFAVPAVPVAPGALATPLGLLGSRSGSEQIAGAYAFGILAGRSGRAASGPELAAAGQILSGMIGSDEPRTRVAGARVAGRVFAVPFDEWSRPMVTPHMIDGLFAMLNHDNQLEQLAAMDALGLLREPTAVGALTERYRFFRDRNRRALAGGALEALARIGYASAIPIVRELTTDRWADGRDATALAVLFARERMLGDGSITAIRNALNDRSRRDQARGYLV